MNWSTAKQLASIWVFTFGSRGDHEPIAALALGLRKEGYRVKVFGRGIMGAMFHDRGLDFNAVDIPAPLANAEGRAELGRLAEAEGFKGPGKEEECVLDTILLQQEHNYRLVTKRLADGESMHQIVPDLMATDQRIKVLLVTGGGLASMGAFREELTTFLAEQAGLPVEEYEPAARERRALLRASAQRAAEKLGISLLDFVRLFFETFSNHISSLCSGAEDSQILSHHRNVSDFYGWHDASVDLDAYWEDWLSRFPRLEAAYPSGGGLADVGALAHQLLLPKLESASPDLVICAPCFETVGLHLQATRGIRMLPMRNDITYRTLSEGLLVYKILLGYEGEWEGFPTPLRDLGPLPYLDLTRKMKYIASFSPLRLAGASASRQYFKAFCTGKWVLDDPSSEGCPTDNMSLFGGPEEHASLKKFLASADDPPICMGWGSMSHPSPQALAAVVVKALRFTGRRGVVIDGFSGLRQDMLSDAIQQEYKDCADPAREAARAEERLLLLTSASHEFLFPQCACLVHHGGAGTCHAALRSGVPSVVTPLVMDQPINADWIESLGCGTKAASMHALDADGLSAALKRVLGDTHMKARAKEVAASMARERGVPAAVEIVEECLREPAPEPAPLTLLKQECPWKDGVYHAYMGDEELPLPACIIRGNDIIAEDGETELGQIRCGFFVVEEGEKDNLVPGTYSVEAAFTELDSMSYGHVSDDGTLLWWSEGITFRLQ